MSERIRVESNWPRIQPRTPPSGLPWGLTWAEEIAGACGGHMEQEHEEPSPESVYFAALSPSGVACAVPPLFCEGCRGD